MPFVPKTWQNRPSTATPISAAAFVDLETRLSAYADDRSTWVEPGSYMTLLPGYVRNEYQGYNGGQNIVTARGYEYAVWVRQDGHPVISQRRQGRGAWAVPTDLTAIFGTIVADGHNFFSMAVDGNGVIHVSGNMHAVPLKYARSNSADSIAAFTSQTMAGGTISEVTYPAFTALPSGDLLFWYRDKASGNGDYHLKRWTVASGTWAHVGKILDGVSSGESPYTTLLTASQDGTKLGAGFVWRGDGLGPDSSHDLCFIQSVDGGTTWTSISGVPVASPVTMATAPKVLTTAASGSGIFHCNMDWDLNGRPHLAAMMYDANGCSNIRHFWWDGSSWQNEFVTFGTWRMSLTPPLGASGAIVDGSVSRAGVVCSDTGRTYVIWRGLKDGARGTLRAIDVTTPGAPLEFTICNIDVGYQEPLWFDMQALRGRSRLQVLLTQQPFSQPGLGEYGNALNWLAQWGGVLSVDLRRLPDLMGPQGGRPTQRGVRDISMPQGTTPSTTSTTAVDIAGTPAVPIDPDWATQGRMAFARLVASVTKVTAGSGTWTVVQKDPSGQLVTSLASVTQVVGTGLLTTPWVPIQLDKLPTGGTIGIRGNSSDANATTLNSASLQLALMEDASGELVSGGPTIGVWEKPNTYLQGLTSGLLLADWDVSQVSGVANAAALPSIPDRSRRGTPMVSPPFAMASPIYNTAVINGRAVATFNGTTQIMHSPGFQVEPLFTVIIVAKRSTGAAAAHVLIQDSAGAPPSGRGFHVGYNDLTTARGICFAGPTPNPYTDTQAATSGAFHVISVVAGDAAVQTWVDGVTDGSTARVLTPDQGGSGEAATYLGAQGFGNSFQNGLDGQVARVMVFNGALSSAERHAIEVGLGADYAITIT